MCEEKRASIKKKITDLNPESQSSVSGKWYDKEVSDLASVPDPWRFDTDPDPRIRATWLRNRLRIRIPVFSSVAVKIPTKNRFLFSKFFLLITFCRYVYICFQDNMLLRSTGIVLTLLKSRFKFMWMRSSWVVRASDSQCRSRNCPRYDPSILRHSGIWGAADKAVLNILHEKKKSKNATNNFLKFFSCLCLSGLWIRINFLRIRIRIQSLMLEANTDPGL